MPNGGWIRYASLAVLISLACTGCTAPKTGGATAAPKFEAAQAAPSASVSAVRAFARICSRLEGEEVARQAQTYNFV